jgi:uncharacterized damage-inducible protein DinB
MNQRPETNEYASYYSTYVGLVPKGNILQILKEQVNETMGLVKDISEAQALFRYGPGKWSIKEVIGHMSDTERVMAYRLLCFARGDVKGLPGFNENEYVLNASFDNQSISDLLDNLLLVRKATLQLIKSLDSEAWLKRGNANNVEVTVRALAYIIAGHEIHHRNIINQKYISSRVYPIK